MEIQAWLTSLLFAGNSVSIRRPNQSVLIAIITSIWNEVETTAHVCDGQLGDEGPEGQQGEDGSQGYSALIEQHPAPTSVCPKGIVMQFGVDDGTDQATANDGILHQDEVKESLRICSEQLYEGLTGDIFSNFGDSMSTVCDQSEWSDSSSVYVFSATNGFAGCELWVLDEENIPSMLMDIHASGDLYLQRNRYSCS